MPVLLLVPIILFVIFYEITNYFQQLISYIQCKSCFALSVHLQHITPQIKYINIMKNIKQHPPRKIKLLVRNYEKIINLNLNSKCIHT